MNLAISNIAWDVEASQVMYERMKKLGFRGLEIAPTKFFPNEPYSEDNILGARMLHDIVRQAFDVATGRPASERDAFHAALRSATDQDAFVARWSKTYYFYAELVK